MILVKKDGGIAGRVCSDIRGINTVTIPNRCPLPRIDDYLQMLAGAKWVTMMDHQSGYWQVLLAEKNKPSTAFQVG